MLKFFSVAFCGAVLAIQCHAQSDIKPNKKFNHYIGFQANELMRQLINFDNTTTEVNNPYLGVYAIEFAKSGYGAHIGAGYSYLKTINKENPGGRATNVDKLFYRIGAQKNFSLSKRFRVTLSLDFTASYQLDKTFIPTITDLGSVIDSTESTTLEKITSIGGGPRASLNFHITDRLILATEAMLYYNAQKQKKNIFAKQTITEIFNNNNQQVSISNSNTASDIDDFSFTIPASLFLIVKF